MDKTEELTNVPDYQKIQASGGGPNTSAEHDEDWHDDVQTLTPSPLVRPPTSASASRLPSMPSPSQYGNFSHGAWEGSKQAHGTTMATSKASWEAQQQQPQSAQYNASRYGLVSASRSMSSFKEEPSYIPQGFSQPVTKYIDANGVERRILRRNISPNRRSYTEGFLVSDGSGYPAYNDGGLKAASSQKNLNQDFASPSVVHFKRDLAGSYGEGLGDRSPRSGVYATKTASFTAHQQKGGAMPAEDQWKEIGGGHIAVNKPSVQEDLRHWQQQHQEELLHQHLETQALYETPNNQSQYHHHHHSAVDSSFSKMVIQEEPPARWEPVRRAADNIIREKNMIIDKLKNRILELEEDYRASESKLRQALMSKDDDAELVQQKLQELQHKNLNLKDQLNEERAKKNSEIDDLEVKLGSAEHEIQQLKEALRNRDLSVSDMHLQFEEKSREAEAWKEKFDDSRRNHHDMKKKLDSLQRYLDELPTVDESRIQAQQMMSIREENLSCKGKIETLEKKLTQARKIITSRDFQIREMEDTVKELEKKLSDAGHELERLRDTEGSEFYNTQRELNSTKSDKERLAIDLEKAKKLLETTHGRLRQVEMKYQAELRQAQERITQEEEAGASLRNEISAREAQIDNMKKSMKEFGVRNQELLEQNLMVKEQIRHMEIAGSGSTEASTVAGMQRKFMVQLGLCFTELHALVQVCLQRARGEDPDISVLLGVQSSEESQLEGASSGQQPSQTMSQWMTKLGELRREVDKLRAHICNRYAEDMGDNITCATQ